MNNPGARLCDDIWTLAGSDGGSEHWVAIASFIETTKLNDVDPDVYLACALTRIVAGHPQSQLDDLLPWDTPPHHSKPWPDNSGYEISIRAPEGALQPCSSTVSPCASGTMVCCQSAVASEACAPDISPR